jgi:hypothetical protein
MTTDFSAFTYTEITAWALLVAIVLMYPRDTMMLFGYLGLKISLVCLNCFLLIQAWRIHRQLCSDLAKMGLPKPAFHFTPIWDR